MDELLKTLSLGQEELKLLTEGLDWLHNHVDDTGAPDYLPTEKHHRIEALRKKLTT